MKPVGMALGAALFAATMLAGTGGSAALELRAGSGASLPHPAAQMFVTFMDKVKELSGGEITARHLGPEVAPLNNVIPNLQGGVLDVGNVTTQYFPADFPNFALLAELAVLGENPLAMTGAVTEYVLTCEECLAEFTSKGMVYLGTSASTNYQILSRDPITSLDQLKGKRLRSGSAAFTRWAQAMGVVPVEISFNEEFEAAASGLIDGSIAAPGNLNFGKLYEIVGNVTLLNIGTNHTGSQSTVRQEIWKGLSPEARGWLVKSALAGIAAAMPLFKVSDDEALTHVKVHQPDDSLKAKHQEAQASAMAATVQSGLTRYNLPDAQARVDRFKALVDKWNGIVGEIGQDNVDALAQKLEADVFSKVDLASYGN